MPWNKYQPWMTISLINLSQRSHASHHSHINPTYKDSNSFQVIHPTILFVKPCFYLGMSESFVHFPKAAQGKIWFSNLKLNYLINYRSISKYMDFYIFQSFWEFFDNAINDNLINSIVDEQNGMEGGICFLVSNWKKKKKKKLHNV